MLYLTFTFQIEIDDGSVTSTKMFCQNKDLRNLIRCPTYISSSLDYCNGLFTGPSQCISMCTEFSSKTFKKQNIIN